MINLGIYKFLCFRISVLLLVYWFCIVVVFFGFIFVIINIYYMERNCTKYLSSVSSLVNVMALLVLKQDGSVQPFEESKLRASLGTSSAPKNAPVLEKLLKEFQQTLFLWEQHYPSLVIPTTLIRSEILYLASKHRLLDLERRYRRQEDTRSLGTWNSVRLDVPLPLSRLQPLLVHGLLRDTTGAVIESWGKFYRRIAVGGDSPRLITPADRVKLEQWFIAGAACPERSLAKTIGTALHTPWSRLDLVPSDSMASIVSMFHDLVHAVHRGIHVRIDLGKLRAFGAPVLSSQGRAEGVLGVARAILAHVQMVDRGSVAPAHIEIMLPVSHPDRDAVVRWALTFPAARGVRICIRVNEQSSYRPDASYFAQGHRLIITPFDSTPGLGVTGGIVNLAWYGHEKRSSKERKELIDTIVRYLLSHSEPHPPWSVDVLRENAEVRHIELSIAGIGDLLAMHQCSVGSPKAVAILKPLLESIKRDMTAAVTSLSKNMLFKVTVGLKMQRQGWLASSMGISCPPFASSPAVHRIQITPHLETIDAAVWNPAHGNDKESPVRTVLKALKVPASTVIQLSRPVLQFLQTSGIHVAIGEDAIPKGVDTAGLSIIISSAGLPSTGSRKK